MKQLTHNKAVTIIIAVLGMMGSVGAWAIAAHAHSQYITEREYTRTVEFIEKDLDLLLDLQLESMKDHSPTDP